MSALLRWVRSLVATDVKVGEIFATELFCGEEKLICSIVIKESKRRANFSKHKNEIKVLSESGTVFTESECNIRIHQVDDRQLYVYCLAKRAGEACVKLDLGKRFNFEGESDLPLVFYPSCPTQFTLSDISGDKYVGGKIYTRLCVFDQFNNRATACDHDINIVSNPPTAVTLLRNKQINGEYFITLSCDVMSNVEIDILFSSSGRQTRECFCSSTQLSRCVKSFSIDISQPPISIAESVATVVSPLNCCLSAGSQLKVELEINDVFGNPAHPDLLNISNITAIERQGDSIYVFKSQILSTNYHNKKLLEITPTQAGTHVVDILLNGENFSPGLTVPAQVVAVDPLHLNALRITVEVKPDFKNTHWEDTIAAQKPSAYKHEHLMVTAKLLDNFGNNVAIDHVHLPYLLQQSGPLNGLKSKSRVINENTIIIDYYFSKLGTYQLSFRCLGSHGTDDTAFSVIIRNAPVDPLGSMVTWVPTYEDIPEQPLLPDDEVLHCRLHLKDTTGNNYDGTLPPDCNLMVRHREGQEKCILTPRSHGNGYFDATVPLQQIPLKEDDLRPMFWFFFDQEIIPHPLVLSFAGFKNYDNDLCILDEEDRTIICKNTKQQDITGPGNSYLNNIKRICKMQDNPMVIEYRCSTGNKEPLTVITFPQGVLQQIRTFHEVLLHLLKALYYRAQAFQADKQRKTWGGKATENFQRIKNGEKIDKQRPRFCSKIKERYATLMKRNHQIACEEFFWFFNVGRSQSIIDLHGLLVVDEIKLREYERQLHRNNQLRNHEVKAKIEEQRQHGDEAIRKLKQRLDNYDLRRGRKEGEPWLEIIVGSGHHSKITGQQKIRPKVEQYLAKEGYPYSPLNKGALVVTFEKYSGSEPCFGEYYCQRCDSSWRNQRSWVDECQECHSCYNKDGVVVECFPLKQRSKQ